MRVFLIAIIFLGLYFAMTEGSKSDDNQPVLKRDARNASPTIKKKKKQAAKSGRGNSKPRSKKKNGP